jgi:hypothetical protein
MRKYNEAAAKSAKPDCIISVSVDITNTH